jgi:hypothetical protein
MGETQQGADVLAISNNVVELEFDMDMLWVYVGAVCERLGTLETRTNPANDRANESSF